MNEIYITLFIWTGYSVLMFFLLTLLAVLLHVGFMLWGRLENRAISKMKTWTSFYWYAKEHQSHYREWLKNWRNKNG